MLLLYRLTERTRGIIRAEQEQLLKEMANYLSVFPRAVAISTGIAPIKPVIYIFLSIASIYFFSYSYTHCHTL